jgi:ATP-binding cassette, subfamily C, bacterial
MSCYSTNIEDSFMSRDGNEISGGSIGRTVRVFLRDFASYAGRKGVWAAIYVALGTMLEGIGLILIVPLLGIVIGNGAASGRLQKNIVYLFDCLSVHKPSGRLVVLLTVFGVLMVFRNFAISRRDAALAELQIGFVESKRLQVMKQLAAAQWNQVARLRHARITHLMSGDIQRIGVASHFMLQCAVSIAMLLVQTVLAFVVAPFLALLACAILVIGVLFLYPLLRRARDIGTYVTNANLTILNSTTQFLGGLKLAISQNLQLSFVAEFEEMLRHLTRRQISHISGQTQSRLAFATLYAAVGAAAILVGYLVLGTAPSVLIVFLLILARMNVPASQIQQGVQQFAQSLPAYEKVKELEAELQAACPTPGLTGTIDSVPNSLIEFRNVEFYHPSADNGSGRSQGIRDLNLTIAPGEFIGVIGPSGAGKTTFADLLVGLFPPQIGQILIGDAVLDDARIACWRENISYVSQDPFLFHDTVRRNLSWANPDAGEQDMWEALAIAGADDLVRRMEFGLNTVVGERGMLISGGERQRIALARAVLRKPQLLVLDEAMSAIDVESEQTILGRLSALRPQATIVMIAHRAESLALCGRMLRFETGRLTLDRKIAVD